MCIGDTTVLLSALTEEERVCFIYASAWVLKGWQETMPCYIDIYGLVQDCGNSNVWAVELL